MFHAEAGFDWNQLLLEANSQSLFADKKIIELRIANGKPGDKGSKALQAYPICDDNLLLVICPKLDRSAQRSKWVQRIEQDGASVQIWPVGPQQLHQLIGQRLKQADIQANRAAIDVLSIELKATYWRPYKKSKSSNCWHQQAKWTQRRCPLWWQTAPATTYST